MKREIKFRAWDYWLKRFVKNEYLMSGTNNGIMDVAGVTCNNSFDDLHEDVVMMQFTGLNDKNKKEVYDGDIIKVTNKGIYNGNKVVVWDEILLCYVLVWCSEFDKWTNSSGGITFLKLSSGISCEIIGNIYSTPELLNQSKV